MECTCAQTRPLFVLSSERVFGEWSQNPCLLQGKKIPFYRKSLLKGGPNRHLYKCCRCLCVCSQMLLTRLLFCCYCFFYHHRLVGLVVKASTSRAEDPGFESRLLGGFPGSSHTSDLEIGTPVATLPGARRYRVSAGTGLSGVSIL